MFEYDSCILVPPNVIFHEVTLLQDLYTHKGTYLKGKQFAEVYLEFPSLLMTFMTDHPHTGYITEVEINVMIEPDL
jgi:hypothetical protein